VVHDGEAALERLRDPALRPDLLILDVMMPGRDGLETLRELRVQYRLPVIMLSARGEPVDRVVGLELGADDYRPSRACHASCWRGYGPSSVDRPQPPAAPCRWASWCFTRASGEPASVTANWR
jgi:hypothetical protein